MLAALLAAASGSSTPFINLRYPHPRQCERQQCLDMESTTCREELPGFFLKERGCPDEMSCTQCLYGNLTFPTMCICEYKPVVTTVGYAEQCDMRRECGEGVCYRPCSTFLHVSQCPDYCMWNQTSRVCVKQPPADERDLWATLIPPETEVVAGAEIMLENIAKTSFPMTFPQFEAGAVSYELEGFPLDEVTPVDVLFGQLDTDANGLLNSQEFSNLPVLLGDAELVAKKMKADAEARMLLAQPPNRQRLRRLAELREERRLHAEAMPAWLRRLQDAAATDEGLGVAEPDPDNPLAYTDTEDLVMNPEIEPEVCKADGGKMYCPTDMACHPTGDCSNCPSMLIADHAQHKCLEPWWETEPMSTWTSWICRDRKKVGMSCRYDMDCLYGMKSCLQGTCRSLAPYNADHLCATDYDCPHVGYYCPDDPTKGEDPYFKKFCRRQLSVGDKCTEDRECYPGTLCNDVERPPRCRGYFSIEKGEKAKDSNLCISGWTDKYDNCAVAAQSKSVGRSCGADADCETTDQTGKTGVCSCKVWWDR